MAKMMQTASKTTGLTQTQSTTVVRNIFRAAFSSIAYIRNFFDEDCFRTRKIGSFKYHRLVTTTTCADARVFVDWLERGIFDALTKKYLQIVLLEVYDGTRGAPDGDKTAAPSSRELLECFSFNVSYNEQGAHVMVSDRGAGANAVAGATSTALDTKEQIKQNGETVVRTLVQMAQTLRPLPKKRVLGVRLYYTDETPEDYEPPMFKAGPVESDHWFAEMPLKVRVGVFTTPFHMINLSIRAQTNEENVQAGVLTDKGEGEGEVVDVGEASQGNSVKVVLRGKGKKGSGKDAGESQREGEDGCGVVGGSQDSAELKVRVRPEGSVRSKGSKKRGRAAPSVSMVGKAVGGKKRRKTSLPEKKIFLSAK